MEEPDEWRTGSKKKQAMKFEMIEERKMDTNTMFLSRLFTTYLEKIIATFDTK